VETDTVVTMVRTVILVQRTVYLMMVAVETVFVSLTMEKIACPAPMIVQGSKLENPRHAFAVVMATE
jgi:hypothetical protein